MDINTSFDVVYRDAEKDLNLHIGNVKEKALSEPGSRLKWLKIQMAIRAKVKFLEKEYEKQKKIISTNVSTHEDRQIPIAVKMQKAIKEDPILLKIEETIEELKETLYFVQGVNKIFDTFNFTIKNCLDALKIESQIN